MSLTPEMKGWRSYMFWEGLPFLILFFIFGIIAVLNWPYESKLITPDPQAGAWTEIYFGAIMLFMALGLVLFAAVILFVVRLTRPKSGGQWYMFIALTLVTVLLLFPAVFIVVFGPAAITMKQQMRVESH